MSYDKFELIEGDPKRRKRSVIIDTVKQGTAGHKPVILKHTTNNYTKQAVGYALLIFVILTAIFITYKLLGSKQVEGELVKTSQPVYALEQEAEFILTEQKEIAPTQIEAIVAPVVEELPVVAPEPPKPAVQEPVKPQPVRGTGDCALAYNYAWPQDIAYQICLKESSGNPNAANWSDNHMSWAGCMGSFGLMQVNCSHGQLYDGVQNMNVAYKMYTSWGNSFRAWTTCKKVPGCY